MGKLMNGEMGSMSMLLGRKIQTLSDKVVFYLSFHMILLCTEVSVIIFPHASKV